jgi:hypothetical protein
MLSFVWTEILFEAGESPEHIILRKEAERIAGSGEFWWGVDAPLGITVEVRAERSGGTLPVLFSKSRTTEERHSSQIRIWDAWRSLLHPQVHGRIPDHVVITTGYDLGKRQARYALTCRSDDKLTGAAIGFCDLAQCWSLKGSQRVPHVRKAHVLRKDEPLLSRRGPSSQSVYSIAFKAALVGHCFVLLENFRVLDQGELNDLRNFQAGDNWLSLAKELRSRR